MHVCALNEQDIIIASLKNYFSCVSVENYVAALFKPTSPERREEDGKACREAKKAPTGK